MAITEIIVTYATLIIAKTGLLGVFVLMVMESMVFPIPSEGVMPFAGFLWYQGHFNWLQVLIASTLGSIVGSLISYYIGAYGGELIVKKYGKYFFLNEHHLEQTKTFFNKYGDKTIFISRFVPIVRHLISLPAGFGRMNISKFLIYTTVGATMWNMLLAYAGYLMGSNWELIRHYSETLDKILIVLVVIAVAGWWFWRRKSKKASVA